MYYVAIKDYATFLSPQFQPAANEEIFSEVAHLMYQVISASYISTGEVSIFFYTNFKVFSKVQVPSLSPIEGILVLSIYINLIEESSWNLSSICKQVSIQSLIAIFLHIMSGSTPGTKQKAAIIKFIEEPPKHIFCDSWFDIGLSILTPRITNTNEEISAPIKLKPKLFR